jgi:hypothetical protein
MQAPTQSTPPPAAAEDAPRNPQDAVGLYRKEIRFNYETTLYDCLLDGEVVAEVWSYSEGESTLDALVFELLSGQYFREAQA